MNNDSKNKKPICNRLSSEFNCEKNCKELNKLIKSATKVVHKEGDVYISEPFAVEEHRTLILSHLYEKTDLEHRLNQLKASSYSLNIPMFIKILYELKTVDENVITDKFLDYIDLELDKLKNKEKANYDFITLLNIRKYKQSVIDTYKIAKEEFDVYTNILNLFKIERIDTQELSYDRLGIINSSKDETYLKKILNVYEISNGETINIKISARDNGYALRIANSILEIFFGFLALIRYRFVNHYSSQDFSIEEIAEMHYIILKNGNFNHPNLDLMDEDDIINLQNELTHINLVDLGIWKNSQGFTKFIDIIDFLDKDNKKSLLKNLKEFLRLYYLACSEKSLHYSFLHFWLLAETIIKNINGGGRIKGEEILSIMGKILKNHVNLSIEKFVENRIKYLYQKRNNLVHEGKLEVISREDRDLTKTIADSVLIFYINNLARLNNISEYTFLLQNINKSDEDINRYSVILDSIKKDRNF
ncbi:MAG: HEPN domain-containing protein [Methanobacterium sp. ERen5]|nr:MAG: HEPN domain-containing protein [Methanobacterium sp. ERen5]